MGSCPSPRARREQRTRRWCRSVAPISRRSPLITRRSPAGAVWATSSSGSTTPRRCSATTQTSTRRRSSVPSAGSASSAHRAPARARPQRRRRQRVGPQPGARHVPQAGPTARRPARRRPERARRSPCGRPGAHGGLAPASPRAVRESARTARRSDPAAVLNWTPTCGSPSRRAATSASQTTGGYVLIAVIAPDSAMRGDGTWPKALRRGSEPGHPSGGRRSHPSAL
jgi:hypothetical protein